MSEEEEGDGENPVGGYRALSPEGDEALQEYFADGGDEPLTRIHFVDAPATPRVPLRTNAPGSWPAVRGPPRCEGDPDAFVNALSLLISQALRKAKVHIVEYHREVQLTEFTLIVDLVVEYEGREVPILILPGVDPEGEWRDFQTACEGLAKEGPFVGAPCFYYAPANSGGGQAEGA